jgi:hypothetical protein
LKKPHYHPAVKFRKLNKDTLTRLQFKSDSDESPNADLDDEESEGGGDSEEETLTGTLFGANTSAERRTPFKVDPCMDLNSHALVDMISPVLELERSGQPAQHAPIPVETKDQMSVAEVGKGWWQ